MNEIRTEVAAEYGIVTTAKENEILEQAKTIIAKRMQKGKQLSKPSETKDYFMHHTALLENEVFMMITLNNQNQIIKTHQVASGTINSASVHPREVVKTALKDNASNVIFGHNHPSGNAEISSADKKITNKLESALSLVDIDVLDHIVIAGAEAVSFSDIGEI